MITIEAERLARALAERQCRIVFAESCTAGLVSALLAAVPGISNHLCGSWVTYREECKQAWLGIPAELIKEKTDVSQEVTERMAIESLRRTESAHIAAAITGHLGPDAPVVLDGVCFLAVAGRSGERIELLDQQRWVLEPAARTDRQRAAARRLLAFTSSVLGMRR
jgi:nicotinamide-nucleotide amidase